MSNFSFVSNTVLRSNLDYAFEHIVDLLTLSESESYKDKTTLVSSLRKTIIIHTASIIEALLLWKLKQVVHLKKVELTDEWKYFEIKILHVFNRSEEVIAGKRKKEKKDIDKLDFIRITDLCCHTGIIKSDDFKEKVNKVRELRNRLHIGSLVSAENAYSKKDLEFCFSVARDVKKMVV